MSSTIPIFSSRSSPRHLEREREEETCMLWEESQQQQQQDYLTDLHFVSRNNVNGDNGNNDIEDSRVAAIPPEDNDNQVEMDSSVVDRTRELEEETIFDICSEKGDENESISKKNTTGRTDLIHFKSSGSSSSNNNNTNNNTESDCEQPKQRGIVKKILEKIDVTAIDIFPYHPSEEEYIKPYQTFIGTLGTLITFGLFAFVIVDSLKRFSSDEIQRSTNPRIRIDEDSSEIGQLGVILFHGGKPFYDESFFRIEYRYRAIYNGDMENDIRPRVYVDIPSKTCLLYADNNSPGKNATLGCPDVDAARLLLAAEKEKRMASTAKNNITNNNDIANFPLVLNTRGSYGSDAYWFLEIKLKDCPSYGDAANITCANTTEIENEFNEASMTFDFIMRSQISRTESLWRNLYMEIELDRWTGVETNFQKIYSFETDRFLHKTKQNQLNYSSFHSFTYRTNHRHDSFYTFYIRLHGKVQEEKLAHYSFLDMITDIGGAWEVVMIFMTVAFIGCNYLAYTRKQKRIEKDKLR